MPSRSSVLRKTISGNHSSWPSSLLRMLIRFPSFKFQKETLGSLQTTSSWNCTFTKELTSETSRMFTILTPTVMTDLFAAVVSRGGGGACDWYESSTMIVLQSVSSDLSLQSLALSHLKWYKSIGEVNPIQLVLVSFMLPLFYWNTSSILADKFLIIIAGVQISSEWSSSRFVRPLISVGSHWWSCGIYDCIYVRISRFAQLPFTLLFVLVYYWVI